jgi:hypothetical protein
MGQERCGFMNDQADPGDFAPAIAELHDAFARIRAQLHVLRLAMAGLRDERDVRALLSQLTAIEEELQASEAMLKRPGSAY